MTPLKTQMPYPQAWQKAECCLPNVSFGGLADDATATDTPA